ncbi:flagellar basal body P-ring biosynthesis protein FlgA [Planctomycetes bacterium Pla163]|uniref:Flagellar basal body P-ring biosynthesis protein FlgA n=1 Tax=Rohdeia mirabilis TaxID=2528008 RepID=A0A518D522_9BACT|nr:flagellar basal body P-ring biosynthesis protein FlgA [Planctomycetes bacterium Pla163]
MILCALLLDGASIVLSPDASVTGNSIELGEVATITGVDEATRATLAAIDLGYSPSPGYSRLLFAERVAQAITLVQPGFVFEITGSATCKVQPITRIVESSQIIDVARQALAAAVTGGRTTFELQQGVVDVEVPEGGSDPVVRASLNSADVRTGVQSVTVRVEVDGRAYATRQVHFRVQRWELVAVLERSIPSGTVITADMLEQREVLVPSSRTDSALTSSMLVGAVAARQLEAGRALVGLDVHRPLAVEAQAPIIVEVRRGAVSARAAAIALQGGALGERIRIRIADSSREMFGIVESRSLVVVDLGAN